MTHIRFKNIIEVNNLTKTRVEVGFLKGLAQKALERENKKLNLSIALVGRARIKELNKKYRKKDKPTDVLSFSYGQSGEVVICPEVVKVNAQKYQSVFKEELARVLVHGILHILGYNHREMKNLKYNG